MIYRRRASPLHAARATVGAAWCLALVALALAVQHPVVLATLLVVALAAGAGARVGRVVARSLLWGLPFALVILAVNALVSRQGLTVVGQVLGLDVTAEAVAAGAVFGATAIVLVCFAALYSAAVDPDDLLRALRRVSFRSALTAALATRMVPVLARDARRMADAQRCRAGAPASRLAIVRAVATGAMDRALDVAATLEVRGYGTARRVPAVRRPWSRHDLAFALSAAGLLALAVLVRVFELAPLTLYPRFAAPVDGGVLLAAAAIAVVALLPFLDRRGTAR
jgi:energy-coupling factor transport system permease protein